MMAATPKTVTMTERSVRSRREKASGAGVALPGAVACAATVPGDPEADRDPVFLAAPTSTTAQAATKMALGPSCAPVPLAAHSTATANAAIPGARRPNAHRVRSAIVTAANEAVQVTAVGKASSSALVSAGSATDSVRPHPCATAEPTRATVRGPGRP